MATTVSVSLEVPERRYRPVPAGKALRVGSGTRELRHSGRHRTPVHLDFHVGDLREALTRAERAGARCAQRLENAAHGPAAFCSDPFGHGFCLLGRRPRSHCGA